MKKNSSISIVREIMIEFARSTGLSPAGEHPRRYLWTDAFATCNFLELYRRTGKDKYRSLALHLVDQVHHVLGRHREDDTRTGWISGLDEQEGALHPAIGGLRIGKRMNERSPADRFDEQLEWDRDGQYYHYLTKWMHALNRVSQATTDDSYHKWAVELAKIAHDRFTYVPSYGGRKLMYWKMSIDLSRPLVPSMGQHDPLDGFITYNQLQMYRPEDSDISKYPDLSDEITDMALIMKGKRWATDDLLGIGGLLCDAYKVAQMIVRGYFVQYDLLETMLGSSLLGLETFARMNSMQFPAEYRLAFRELGLSIGLRAVRRMYGLVKENPHLFEERIPLHRYVEELMHYTQLIGGIESFWLEQYKSEAMRRGEHRDINMVMLATSLEPESFLSV